MLSSSWYYVFGVAEPLVNVATTIFITCDAPAFLGMLFAAAPAAPDQPSDSEPTLARMYASVLLCFGLTQAVLWHEWHESPSAGTQRAVRTWLCLMLVPDLHHLVGAYLPYYMGPHGRLDAAFVTHYAIQGLLTLLRLLALVVGTAAPQAVKGTRITGKTPPRTRRPHGA